MELPWCFFWLISLRERTLLYWDVLVGGRYGWNLVNLVYLGLETVVMVLGSKSAVCFCGAGSSEIGKV